MSKRAQRASPVLGTATALIDEASQSLIGRDTKFRHTFEVPVNSVEPDPDQARRRFDDAEIGSLAATMAARGQLQPILLRKHPSERTRWVIVAGERRWRAAYLNGWPTILAVEHEGDPEVLSLIENLQRVDLTPVEEARGLQRLITEKGWTQIAAAEALGKSKGEISSTLRILSLPDSVLNGVLTSELALPKNALIELARFAAGDVRDRLIERARKGELTIRDIRKADAQGTEVPARQAINALRKPSADEFYLKKLERITHSLQKARAAGRLLSVAERDRLARLRDLIMEMLAV